MIDAELLRERLIRLRLSLGTLLSEVQSGGMVSRGGMGDHIRMRVVGPDGEVKRETETK